MRFSLASMFVTTAWVALASAAGSYAARSGVEPSWRFFAWLSVPFFVCAAFGVLRGRRGFWLGMGVANDVAVLGLFVLARIAR
jgi:hypothetical protein